MSFEIKPGIDEADLGSWLEDAAREFGTFEDGRVNYNDAEVAPIVMCTIACGDELLLVKRGKDLADAAGYWSTVNGFIDEAKPVYEHVIQTLKEELKLDTDKTIIKVRNSYRLTNVEERRSYIVFPCLVNLRVKPVISLDIDNTEYAWISKSRLSSYHILDDLPYAINSALDGS